MKKLIIVIIGLSLTFVGCAITYKAPKETERRVYATHSSSLADILNVSQRVLMIEGYRIEHVDKELGLISTAPRNIKMTPEYANCGTTMGINYLKDKRTDTDVSINILIDGNKIEVKANIEGEYKPGDVSQNITLTCISKGVIEREILSQIKAKLK